MDVRRDDGPTVVEYHIANHRQENQAEKDLGVTPIWGDPVSFLESIEVRIGQRRITESCSDDKTPRPWAAESWLR